MQPVKELSVLIAEDDFFVSEIIQKYLEELSYKVLGKASDGGKAVDMTCSLHPDVVLMDIKMPDMDGLEATQEIYKTHPTPVVILSAYDTPDLVEKAGVAGVGAYLVKMPSAKEIDRAIIIAIARFDDMMQLRSFNTEMRNRNEELKVALDRVKVLSGMLPICCNCKKIRDDEDYWHDVADYITSHSDAEFTHGICPDCVKTLYPDLYKKDTNGNGQ